MTDDGNKTTVWGNRERRSLFSRAVVLLPPPPVVLRREPECGGMADMGSDAHASRPALHQMEEQGRLLVYASRVDAMARQSVL